MNKFLQSAMSLLPLAAFVSLPLESLAFEPVAPGNLDADVNGVMVDLSWEWGNAGQCTLSESFEGEQFPPAGWEVKNHYDYDDFGNWMQFDFSDEDPGQMWCHDGVNSALIMWANAGDDEDPSTYHQDEWLIMRPGLGAVYMDFWYFIHPQLLEWGAYRAFPDHYYVLISFDNGENWEELWDGRWDMGDSESMQLASIFLGQETDEDTLVAFNAVSAEDQSLYFDWAIDDVQFYTAEEASSRSLIIRKNCKSGNSERILSKLAGKPLYREFVPTGEPIKKALSQDEWVNNGNITYRLYRDNEILHSYIKSRNYTDYSDKTSGKHTYKVVAWSEAMDVEFDAATVDVQIDDFVFAAPRNVKVQYSLQDNGKYEVFGTWDAPDGELEPSNYIAYMNGKMIGWIDADEEFHSGQTGLYKGVYKFEVEACYKLPDGTSERVAASTFPGTVPAPVSLALSETNGRVLLTWNNENTEDSVDLKPDHFIIYRGDVLLADNVSDTEYIDTKASIGSYDYSVHAVYSDGSVSLPASVSYVSGDVQPLTIPMTESFSNGHMPAGWSVVLLDPNDKIKDMYSWRFDNWFENEVPADCGFEGGFASIDGVAAGMNKIESYVYTPAISLPADIDAVLKFNKYLFDDNSGASRTGFSVAVSPAGEEEFETLADLIETENGEVSLSLNSYKGADIVLRWAFTSRNSGFAAIDNVSVLDGSSVSVLPDSSELFDIFSADGKVIARQVKCSFAQDLPAGIYLLRDNNGATQKFLKK